MDDEVLLHGEVECILHGMFLHTEGDMKWM
jgi:hypothetical protein